MKTGSKTGNRTNKPLDGAKPFKGRKLLTAEPDAETKKKLLHTAPENKEEMPSATQQVGTVKDVCGPVFLDGLYVDVGGTLVKGGHYGFGEPKKMELDQKVLELIEARARDGTRVVIFTGGSPRWATEELRELGVPEKFLPVRSKEEFRGKLLGELVDDIPPEKQNFLAKKWIDANK